MSTQQRTEQFKVTPSAPEVRAEQEYDRTPEIIRAFSSLLDDTTKATLGIKKVYEERQDEQAKVDLQELIAKRGIEALSEYNNPPEGWSDNKWRAYSELRANNDSYKWEVDVATKQEAYLKSSQLPKNDPKYIAYDQDSFDAIPQQVFNTYTKESPQADGIWFAAFSSKVMPKMNKAISDGNKKRTTNTLQNFENTYFDSLENIVISEPTLPEGASDLSEGAANLFKAQAIYDKLELGRKQFVALGDEDYNHSTSLKKVVQALVNTKQFEVLSSLENITNENGIALKDTFDYQSALEVSDTANPNGSQISLINDLTNTTGKIVQGITNDLLILSTENSGYDEYLATLSEDKAEIYRLNYPTVSAHFNKQRADIIAKSQVQLAVLLKESSANGYGLPDNTKYTQQVDKYKVLLQKYASGDLYDNDFSDPTILRRLSIQRLNGNLEVEEVYRNMPYLTDKDLTDLLDVQSGGTLRAGETILKSIMSSIGVNSGEEGFAALLNLESTKDWVKQSINVLTDYLVGNNNLGKYVTNDGKALAVDLNMLLNSEPFLKDVVESAKKARDSASDTPLDTFLYTKAEEQFDKELAEGYFDNIERTYYSDYIVPPSANSFDNMSLQEKSLTLIRGLNYGYIAGEGLTAEQNLLYSLAIGNANQELSEFDTNMGVYENFISTLSLEEREDLINIIFSGGEQFPFEDFQRLETPEERKALIRNEAGESPIARTTRGTSGGVVFDTAEDFSGDREPVNTDDLPVNKDVETTAVDETSTPTDEELKQKELERFEGAFRGRTLPPEVLEKSLEEIKRYVNSRLRDPQRNSTLFNPGIRKEGL